MRVWRNRWLWGYIGVLVAITTLPYLYAQAAAGEGWVFTGFLFAVQDGNSYLAKMLRGAWGEWLFRTPYTAFPQRGLLAFLPYLLLGKLLGPGSSHGQLVVAYHAFRLAGLALQVFAVYHFASLFLQSTSERRLATVVATLGGGLGWLAALALGMERAGMPLEWYSPEWFGFLGLLGIPHLALVRGLLLLLLAAYVRAARAGAGGMKAGMWALALALVHPLGLVTGLVLIGLHLAGLWLGNLGRGLRRLRPWLIPALTAGVGGAPLLLYHGWNLMNDPFLVLWTAQNRLPAPPPLQGLLAYLLFAAATALGFRGWLRRWPAGTSLLILWAVALPLIAYLPIAFQRRLVDGGLVAWSVLAVGGLGTLRLPWRRVALPLLLGMAIMGNMLFLVGASTRARRPSEPLFRPQSEVRSFEWFGAQARLDQVVVTAFETGNALPAWVPVRVVLGHPVETVQFEQATRMVAELYAGKTSTEALCQWTTEKDIAWIFYGPHERALGPFPLRRARGLQLAYREQGIEIFRVDEAALCASAASTPGRGGASLSAVGGRP